MLVLLSCNNKENQTTLFTEVSPAHTHIDFRNDIKEDEQYNILTYEYLYNGGGVAVGDINNDGLPDIIFTGNMTSNKLYLNKGNFQFEDITEKAGVQGRSKWKTGVVMADVNGDGLLDIYVCYSGPGTDADRANELYINDGVNKDGIPTFTESAKKYGLDAPGTYTTTVVFFDMDNDGDLDMFMVNHADMFYNPFFNTGKLRAQRHPKFGNRLYRNDGGVFTDISEQAHIDGSGLNFGLSVAISDINGDGWPDIYVTNDYDERDFLYLNNHNGTFREVLGTSAGHISEFAMGSDISDYNNDGKTDIMVLDMLPEDNHRQKLLKGPDAYDKYMMRVNAGFHHQQMRNTLQLNNGNDSSGAPIFSEVGQLAGVFSTDWSWAPLFADFDNDGWKDLFISNGILRDMTNLDFVKYTSGYTADSVKLNDPVEMWKVVRSMPSTRLTNYLFRNDHNLGFTNETKNWGFTKGSVSNGAVYADLDNDGYLDLVINRLNDKPSIYRNNGAQIHPGRYLRLRLKGEGKNSFGIGAKVYINTDQGTQMQEEFLTRGFQSSVDPIMHFGLGTDSIIQSITVKWPGGKESLLKNVKADTFLVIDAKNALLADKTVTMPVSKKIFRDVTQSSGIQFSHHQSKFVDFKISPLLPYELSKIGPCIAKADVNGDGLEDLFIGASAGNESVLYLQTGDGKFVPAKSQPWNADKNITNADAVFFDADGDGDQDLYLVSGGADYPLNSQYYQDRIFENDGHGNFKKLDNALPAETISSSCARAADINKDGLPDLFVGGRIKPGFFPEAPESFILKNKSVPGHILFEKDTGQTDTLLRHPGMVADAVWVDLNDDGWKDLVVVGEFMPVTIFENHNGRLTNATAVYGLSETQGWYHRILAGDFDHDGKTDLIIGNLGDNTAFKASVKEPISIVYGDFYDNGYIDPILCYYNNGKSYPYYSRDELVGQVPSLQKKILHYADYADAQLPDLFTKEQLANAGKVIISNTGSLFLRNEGNKKFALRRLPEYAQVSAMNGIVAADLNNDGYDDIIAAGNFYPFRAQSGPLDAGIGIVLLWDRKGGFTPLVYAQTGLCLRGDVRNIIRVNTRQKDKFFIIAAKNNDEVQVVEKLP
jgi:hypothetical protein